MAPEMPLLPSRNARPAGHRGRLPIPAPRSSSLGRSSPTQPVRQQALKILLAGIDKDERRVVEATIREALGGRASSGPWSISVVSFGGHWSVTLDGPGDRFRGLSFVAEPGQLRNAIREAIDGPEGAASGTTPDAILPLSTQVRETHVCEHCQQTLVVVYELRLEEPKTLAPLACPHCWKVGHVEIGEWAAIGSDYRSEKG